MAFEIDPAYKEVPERIADFKAKHPEGCLRPADLEHPYRIETIGDRIFIVYVAAAYRSPTDPLPGIGTAYEPFPGRTPYTKDSELQNAETSAWGRAIVAALASESKSVASAGDIRNRRADQAAQNDPPLPGNPTYRPDLEADPEADRLRTLITDALQSGRITAEQAQKATDAHGVGRTDTYASASASVMASVVQTLGLDEPNSPTAPTAPNPLATSIRELADQPWTPTEDCKAIAFADPLVERRTALLTAAKLIEAKNWTEEGVRAHLGGKTRKAIPKVFAEFDLRHLMEAVEALEKVAGSQGAES